MADAQDLKSCGGLPPCGFDPRLGYWVMQFDVPPRLTSSLAWFKGYPIIACLSALAGELRV
jgi:hypothetical protein